jgi:hypothetical protein
MQLVRLRAATTAANKPEPKRFYLHRFDACSIDAVFEKSRSERFLPHQQLRTGDARLQIRTARNVIRQFSTYRDHNRRERRLSGSSPAGMAKQPPVGKWFSAKQVAVLLRLDTP